jgi:hypothetical protein
MLEWETAVFCSIESTPYEFVIQNWANYGLQGILRSQKM